MLSTRTLGIAMTTLGFLGLTACSSSGVDGQVGQMGIVGPAGPVGPMGSAGPSGTTVFDELDLPGTGYYPESLTSAVDGTIFVGSLSSTTIVKFAPGSNTAVTFISQASAGKNIAGVLVDEVDKSLLACVNDFTVAPGTFAPYVKRYSLADGSEKASYLFPAPAACNDMAFDGKHNLYVTDSYGKIYQLPVGGQNLVSWSTDGLLAPPANGFGADGIAWDGQSNLYVNNIGKSTLMRIPIDPNTSASGAAVAITVTPMLSGPDGMRSLDANTLVVVEGGSSPGRLTRLTISGTTATGTSLSNRLDSPTAVTKIGANFFVSEGQLPHFFAMPMTTPNIPFLVRRVPNF